MKLSPSAFRKSIFYAIFAVVFFRATLLAKPPARDDQWTVVAEASFANLREASYDYAGMRRSPLLGMTLLPASSSTLAAR